MDKRTHDSTEEHRIQWRDGGRVERQNHNLTVEDTS